MHFRENPHLLILVFCICASSISNQNRNSMNFLLKCCIDTTHEMPLCTSNTSDFLYETEIDKANKIRKPSVHHNTKERTKI